MNKSSRRGFLVATGTGVAAVAAVPPLLSAATASAAPNGPSEVVAYINDGKTGSVSIVVGEREVKVTDPDLVKRIQSHLRA